MAARRFSLSLANAAARSMVIGIRAGDGKHRFLAIWAVVVDGRVFVRSWTMKASGWHRQLLADPIGALDVAGRRRKIRARLVRGSRLLAAVDRAYAGKYPTKASKVYVRGLSRGRRRAGTLELLPR